MKPVFAIVALLATALVFQANAKPLPKFPPSNVKIEKAIIGEWRGVSVTSQNDEAKWKTESKFDALWQFKAGGADITQDGKRFAVNYRIAQTGPLARIKMTCFGSGILDGTVKVEKDTLTVSYVVSAENVTLTLQRVVAGKEP